MALDSHKSYLHMITGGFDNEKRRAVRKLFSESVVSTETIEQPDETIKIAIGILEEFYNINVSVFTLDQAVDVVRIFNLGDRFTIVGLQTDIGKDLSLHFSGPFLRLPRSQEDDTWQVPREAQIIKLKTQFDMNPSAEEESDDFVSGSVSEWRSMSSKS